MSTSQAKDTGGVSEVVQSPSNTTGQQDQTSKVEGEDQAEKQTNPDTTEDEMQGHPATQEQALQYETEVKEQDRWLPIANVARIMKTALPDNAKIAKDAKECMQECVSEFISFITSEAAEKCQLEKRKTVNGEDILFAMGSLGFENYGEALKIYLARYRETNVSKNEAQQQNRPTSGYETSANTEPQPAEADDDVGDVGRAVDPAMGAAAPAQSQLGNAPAFVGSQELYPGSNGSGAGGY